MRKFGYPHSILRDYDHWTVLLRPKQATLGALVLACKQPVTDFGQVSAAGFVELKTVVQALEAALKQAFAYQKLNYLMLMMVDKDVHFHVLPRYSASRQFAGLDFSDPGWPGPPEIAHCTPTEPAVQAEIAALLDQSWP